MQGSVEDYRQAVQKAQEAWKTWREVCMYGRAIYTTLSFVVVFIMLAMCYGVFFKGTRSKERRGSATGWTSSEGTPR